MLEKANLAMGSAARSADDYASFRRWLGRPVCRGWIKVYGKHFDVRMLRYLVEKYVNFTSKSK